MPARAARTTPLVALAVLAVAALTACDAQSPGVGLACPAIGYSDTLHVAVAGDAAHVRLCVAADCTPASRDAFVTVSTTSDGDTWTFDGLFPEEFTIRVLDADREVLADVPADLDWVRTGGSERCGGPREASTTIRL